MDHRTTKKAKISGRLSADEMGVAVHQLEDIMAIILGWLCAKEIMAKRRVCKKWKEAARKTIVPVQSFLVASIKIIPHDFFVNSIIRYNLMRVMTEALPNLQQITIDHFGEDGHRWSDGEDPDEEWAARHDHWPTHDIQIISNFRKLRILKIWSAGLNGRYPFLFNSFPLLQHLSIQFCRYLKWDLEVLAGFPVLRELSCIYNNFVVTGNISSLRVLKGTLEKVNLQGCDNVEGDFMDLADFPHLKELDLRDTAVAGNIRDIGENDFTSLERLDLPKGVSGGMGYELQRISDGPDVVRAVYLLKKQRPALKIDVNRFKFWYAVLSKDSPDWYEPADFNGYNDPFHIQFVQAGSRLGCQWYENLGNTCEVNWLDPEPDRDSSDYEEYIEGLQEIERRVGFYRGFHQPPTEEEYRRLLDEHHGG
jgi:hypothetical protein